MKNIVFVIGELSNGGAERVVVNLANEMNNIGYKVSIILLYRSVINYELEEDIDVVGIEQSGFFAIDRAINRLIRLRRAIIELKPDYLISFLTEENIYTIIASAKRNFQLTISERNDPYHDPQSRFFRLARRYLYKYADGIVFQSEYARDYFKPKTIPVKATVIKNPLQNDLPYKEETSNGHFITACRLYEQKNIPMMIDAVYEVNKRGYNSCLDIYGEGPLEDSLRKYVHSRGLDKNVSIFPFTAEIHKKMTQAIGYLNTSVYEGISNSILEAVAIGLPVVATNCPIGTAKDYVINGKNGFVIECNDIESCAVGMIDIINGKFNDISCFSRAVRDDLSAKKITEQWLFFLQN